MELAHVFRDWSRAGINGRGVGKERAGVFGTAVLIGWIAVDRLGNHQGGAKSTFKQVGDDPPDGSRLVG